MSNAKHTPGPWEVAFRADGSSYISMGCPAAGQHKQFDLMLVAGSGNDEEDARLIAAAPELLEALKELLSVSSNPLHLPETKRDTEDKARAAIAKATGESA